MSDLTQLSAKDRITFYREQIMRRNLLKGQHASRMLKIYQDLLSSALEGQQMDEREHY